MDELIARSAKVTAFLVLIVAASLVSFRNLPWAMGLLIGATWSITNFLLIASILKIAILKVPQEKLAALLVVKFPILYLIGFFILNSKRFPIMSLLSGLISVLIVMGILKIWPKRI